MKRKRFLGTIIVVLIIFALTGCAGPKFISRGPIFHQYWGDIPYQKDLSIIITSSTTIEKEAAELFTETLTKGLESQKLFGKIFVISPIEATKTDIVLEVNIENIIKTGWWARGGSYSHEPCSVAVTGKLIDVKQDKTILTFSRERSGEGGLLGIGGWLRAGRNTMTNKLVKWVSDDIVKIIANKGEKEGGE